MRAELFWSVHSNAEKRRDGAAVEKVRQKARGEITVPLPQPSPKRRTKQDSGASASKAAPGELVLRTQGWAVAIHSGFRRMARRGDPCFEFVGGREGKGWVGLVWAEKGREGKGAVRRGLARLGFFGWVKSLSLSRTYLRSRDCVILVNSFVDVWVACLLGRLG